MKPDWAERLQRTRQREYHKGVIAERERIIKLLKHEFLEMEGLEYEHFENICVTCDNIALIKGESQKRTENGTDLTQGENK